MIALASMVALDEDALICDLAETYGVLNYRALPLQLVATLGLGLSFDSRIRQREAGLIVPFSSFLIAQAVDNLSMLCWLQSEDGAKNRNRPQMLTAKLRREDEIDRAQFASADDFEAARMQLLTYESPKEGE